MKSFIIWLITPLVWFFSVLFKKQISYEFNPLVKHRNIRCLCGSGIKAKKCCGKYRVLPAEVAQAVRKALRYQ